MEAVATYGKPVKFSELLASSSYPKATLYRFLKTLTNQKMLTFNGHEGSYSLGIRLVRLAHEAWKHASLALIAKPYVEALVIEVGETVHLAQFENGQVLFVDKLQARDDFETLARAGKVAPAYCTGVGKAMLAFLSPKSLELALQQQAYYPYTENTHSSIDSLSKELDDIRSCCIAYDQQEHQMGIISIATPILSPEKRVMGAISIATSTSLHAIEDLEVFRPVLLETAENIGKEAVSWHFPD